MHDLDGLDRYAEATGNDLRERGFVSLPVAVRPGEHRDAASRIDAHFASLVEAGTRAEGTRNVRRRDTAGFDVRRIADAPQLAALRRLGLAGRKSLNVRDLHRFV